MIKHKSFTKTTILILTFIVGLGLALVLPWLANKQTSAAASQNEVLEQGAPEADNKYYVAKTGNGSGGLSWTTAFTNVQDALAAAVPPAEIWVAKGVYYPDIGSGQVNNAVSSTFVMTDGVALIGGFNFGDNNITDRDWENNVTVLSGDIDWDKGGADITDGNGVVITTSNIISDNAYHVVTGSGVTNTAVLDGFTITAGKADADPPNTNNRRGGGMYNDNGSPTLANVVFSGNAAQSDGGGMFNNRSSPALTNVVFSSNSVEGYGGGGMFNLSGSNPALTNISFSGNSADFGGGMHNDNSSPVLTNVSFSGNSADSPGGGMFNDLGSPALTNVSFSGNSAGSYGGGMSNAGGIPTLTNVTFSGNSAGIRGGGINNSSSVRLDVRNSILWNNQDSSGTSTISATIFTNNATITLTHSLVQGSQPGGIWIGGSFVDGGGNIDEDPLFVLPIIPSIAPTTTGDLRLQYGSPAIDTAEDSFIAGFPTDLDGEARIKDGNGDGSEVVDMGAYEAPNLYSLEVSKTGSGGGLVTSSPAGIDCGNTCSVLLKENSSISLTAVADSGSIFTGWSEDCTGSESCIIKMDKSRKVTSNFEAIPYQVFQPLIFR